MEIGQFRRRESHSHYSTSSIDLTVDVRLSKSWRIIHQVVQRNGPVRRSAAGQEENLQIKI